MKTYYVYLENRTDDRDSEVHKVSAKSKDDVRENYSFNSGRLRGDVIKVLVKSVDNVSQKARDYHGDVELSEIYVSMDIEADGPIPGPNSMLSFGAAAFREDGTLEDTFEVNLETLPGASGDPETMKWWSGQPEAWASCRERLVAPETAMNVFHGWLESLPGKPVFVGYPATYDFMFVYWYLIRFAGNSPFSFSGCDIKSYAMAMLKKPFRQSTKRNMPKRWLRGTKKHTHKALDDAIGQGELFIRMLRENLND